MSSPGLLHVALLAVWDKRCAWCRRAIAVTETEIDHVLPRTLAGDGRVNLLRDHGLPDDYDLLATYNLVPSCRRCNGFKSDRPAPNTPIIAFFLVRVRDVAAKVDEAVRGLEGKAAVARALAVLNTHYPDTGLTPEMLNELNLAAKAAEADIEEVTGTTVPLHPALGMLFNAGAWKVVQEYGTGVVVVTDGVRTGYTSLNQTMSCGHCGGHGPWNGARCMTCGMLDDGD